MTEESSGSGGNAIRTRSLAGWAAPSRVFAALYGNASHAAWLDAGDDADEGHSYLCAARTGTPLLTASVPEGTVTRWVHGGEAEGSLAGSLTELETVVGSVLDLVDADISARGPVDVAAALEGQSPSGFHGGWVGWLGFELGAQTTHAPMHESPYPDAALFYVDRVIEFDHGSRTIRVIGELGAAQSEAEFDEWSDAVARELVTLHALPHQAATEVPRVDNARAVWRHAPDRYEQLIAECQAAIVRGDAYQLCLTNAISVDVRPDPLDCYRALRESSPSHHGGLLRFGDISLLSASPEQFLQISPSGVVTTKPIKGTRKRGASLVRDIELRAELESSDKERAENLMIVDLMRNDLGRIAELGTVRVSKLLAVESYSQVHQLVSTVQARLRPGLSALDAVAASFPAGSMTGAPKISAMTILHGLEGGPRGIYSGVYGYFSRDGAVDLAMVIRSIVLSASGATIGTGGGITALSVPSEEVEETQIKARALLAALGVGPDA